MLAELQSLHDLGYRGHINLLDDNFLGSKVRGLEFLRALKTWSRSHDHPFFFSTDASINLAKEEELLGLMHENDFRYLFVGIESPDENVLLQTQKRHNTGISVIGAVQTFNEYGMSVVGGFILGFDNETEQTSQQMIDLIQDTGIVMAYTGMLVALPNTQLWRRLQQEGRLFHGDLLFMSELDGDYTVSGLNFATVRPRTQIMREYIGVLRKIYDPENFYKRVSVTANNLSPNKKYRPNLATRARQIWALLRVSARAGFDRRTGLLYWRSLLYLLVTKPTVLEFLIMMAALYVHFAKQVDWIVSVLEDKVRHVERMGDEQHDAMMTARCKQTIGFQYVGSVER
jgi:radical SAM superfamily enzyme YgiQ (UPF0313 family)